MELLYVLLVLLFVARLCAELAERLGQPALVGELIAGVALGVVAHRYSGALRAGLFNQPAPTPPRVAYLFSAVVIMAILTTLATPIVMRSLLGAKSS